MGGSSELPHPAIQRDSGANFNQGLVPGLSWLPTLDKRLDASVTEACMHSWTDGVGSSLLLAQP